MNESPNTWNIEQLVRLVYQSAESLTADPAAQDTLAKAEADPEGAELLAGIRLMKADFAFESAEAHLAWLNQKQADFARRQWAEVDLFGEKAAAKRIVLSPWHYAAVAAALVLLILGFWMVSNPPQSQASKIYQQYMADAGRDRLTNPRDLRSNEQAIDSLYVWYETGQYERGINYLNAQREQAANPVPSLLRDLAFFYLQAGQKSESLALFQQLAENPETPYQFEPWLTWGLACLKFEDAAVARLVFARALDPSVKLVPKEEATIREILDQL